MRVGTRARRRRLRAVMVPVLARAEAGTIRSAGAMSMVVTVPSLLPAQDAGLGRWIAVVVCRVGCAGPGLAGQGQEHLVEGRTAQGQVGDLQPGAGQPCGQLGEE